MKFKAMISSNVGGVSTTYSRSWTGYHLSHADAVTAASRKKRSSRCGVVTKASESNEENNLLWQQRRQLESLLRISDTAETGECQVFPGICGASDDMHSKKPMVTGSNDAQPIGASQIIHNLPLWRIQTAVLPGAQVLLGFCLALNASQLHRTSLSCALISSPLKDKRLFST